MSEQTNKLYIILINYTETAIQIKRKWDRFENCCERTNITKLKKSEIIVASNFYYQRFQFKNTDA